MYRFDISGHKETLTFVMVKIHAPFLTQLRNTIKIMLKTFYILEIFD